MIAQRRQSLAEWRRRAAAQPRCCLASCSPARPARARARSHMLTMTWCACRCAGHGATSTPLAVLGPCNCTHDAPRVGRRTHRMSSERNTIWCSNSRTSIAHARAADGTGRQHGLCGRDNARAAALADRLACDRDGLDVVRPAMSRCNRQCLLLRQEQWARRQPRQRSSTPSHRLTSTSWTPRSRHALCSSAYARDAPQMHYRGGELHVGRADSSGSIALVVTDRVTAYHATSVMHISAEAALQRNTASPSSERASAMRSHQQQGAVTHRALAIPASMVKRAL
jgi:hypothetical protein